MSNITDYLQGIMEARYGKDVRQDIHDAIEACYTDGKVGATDTTARNAVTALAARVTALEGAASTGLTTDTLTLEDGFSVFMEQTPTCAKIGPIVMVWGSVKSANDIPLATSGAEYQVATVPEGYRPYADMGIAQTQGYIGDNTYFLDIRTTGEVYIKYPIASPIVANRAINLDMVYIAEDAATSGTATLDEVEDARIGWDATLYASLGDAIRGQIEDIRTDMQDTLDAAAAAQASAVEAAELVDQAEAGGVSNEVRQALYTLLSSAAYAQTGLTDEIAVIQSWAQQITAISVSPTTASITGTGTSQLSAITTPAGGTVAWSSSDTSVATVSSSGLVTGVGNGTCTITASAGGKSATCAVTVTGFRTLTGIEAVYTQSGTVYDTATLDDLEDDLVVTGTYDDSSTETITDYTLSGTLAEGTSTITVSYGGKTTTFTVTVTVTPVVPSGYTSKDYVQSSGNAYIDTGIKEIPGTTSGFWGKFAVSAVSVNKDLWGYQGTASGQVSSYRFLTIVSYDTGDFWYYGAASGASNAISGWTSGVNEVSVSLVDNNTYPVFTVNNVQTTGNKVKTTTTNNAVGTMYLMAQNSKTEGPSDADKTVDGGYIRCYGFKIFESGSAVRDYKPCIRDADSVAGFYDTVTETFYPSIGENAFTAGNDT